MQSLIDKSKTTSVLVVTQKVSHVAEKRETPTIVANSTIDTMLVAASFTSEQKDEIADAIPEIGRPVFISYLAFKGNGFSSITICPLVSQHLFCHVIHESRKHEKRSIEGAFGHAASFSGQIRDTMSDIRALEVHESDVLFGLACFDLEEDTTKAIAV
jgi:hypothetical protein